MSVTYNLDHGELLNSGILTHDEIDEHINDSSNPHGTTLIQTSLQCSTIHPAALVEPDVVHLPGMDFVDFGTNISINGIDSNDDPTPVIFPNGIKVNNSTPITYFHCEHFENVTPDTTPEASASSVNFQFERINNVCSISLSNNNESVVDTDTNPYIFTDLIPTDMVPVSDVEIPLLVWNDTSNVLTTLTLKTDRSVQIDYGYPASGNWTVGSIVIPSFFKSWVV